MTLGILLMGMEKLGCKSSVSKGGFYRGCRNL